MTLMILIYNHKEMEVMNQLYIKMMKASLLNLVMHKIIIKMEMKVSLPNLVMVIERLSNIYKILSS